MMTSTRPQRQMLWRGATQISLIMQLLQPFRATYCRLVTSPTIVFIPKMRGKSSSATLADLGARQDSNLHQTVMSGRRKVGFVDFAAFSFDLDRVCCGSFGLFLVR